MRNAIKGKRGTPTSKLRHGGAGTKGVALLNRLGFHHGFTGTTPIDEREAFAWVLTALGMSPRPATDQQLQAAGETYAVGRLVGVTLAADYPDADPARLAKLAASLWPARTIMPRHMEGPIDAVLRSFKPRTDLLADWGDDVPADGSGPVAKWW